MSIADKLTTIAENEQKVYEKGRTDEWGEFWDAYQKNGSRKNYYYAFTSDVFDMWNDKNFKPKYDMQPTNMNRFMRRCGVTNLEEILDRQGVVLDTSKATMMMLAFGDMSRLAVLPVIDVTSATDSNGASSIFNSDTRLHTIRKLIVAENINFGASFASCGSLKNLIIEGVIGCNLNLSACPLTIESLRSVISCLKDCSTENQGTYTLTLKDTCKTALEADTETIAFNGQSYTYFNLITAKGWNLA